jgi:kynureninase
VDRLTTGCPPVLSVIALRAGVELVGEAPAGPVRAKSIALTATFTGLVRVFLPGSAIEVIGPADPRARGSHVTLRHPAARSIVDGLARRGVVTEFRAPDLVRCGLAPLYVRFVDLWDAVAALAEVVGEVEREGAEIT